MSARRLPDGLPSIDVTAMWTNHGVVIDEQNGLTYPTRDHAARFAASALAALAIFDTGTTDA